MKLAIGCDHGGIDLKIEIVKHLEERGIEIVDFGIKEYQSVNYPEIALPLAKAVAAGECDRGILVCGTGIGMSMAANKVKGIRAAVCSDHFSAKFTRLHNDANILCLGGRVIGPYEAVREDKYYNALQLKYANAITCHKSQGGQWKCVKSEAKRS